MVIRLLVLGCYGNLLGNGPHEPNQLTSNGHHDLVGVFPAGDQFAVPFTEPDLGLPTDVLDRFRVFFESELERPAALLLGTDMPRRLRPERDGQGYSRLW